MPMCERPCAASTAADDTAEQPGRAAVIDLPVTRAGAMRVCVPVEQPGSYAIAVRHDMDGNGNSGWNDGGGFSRNPDISLTNLRPRASAVAINVGRTTLPINVVLNYRFGLSIRPVRG